MVDIAHRELRAVCDPRHARRAPPRAHSAFGTRRTPALRRPSRLTRAAAGRDGTGCRSRSRTARSDRARKRMRDRRRGRRQAASSARGLRSRAIRRPVRERGRRRCRPFCGRAGSACASPVVRRIESKEAHTRSKRSRSADEPVNTDARRPAGKPREREFGEARVLERAAHPRRSVGRLMMMRPDDGRIGGRHRRQKADRTRDFALTDPSEDATEQQDIRRRATRVRITAACVAVDDDHAGQSAPRHGSARSRGDVRRPFDEIRFDAVACRVRAYDVDHVAAVARARGKYPRRTSDSLVQQRAHMSLHAFQAGPEA